jgi:hypothetical protein
MAVGYTEIILRGDSDPEVKEGHGLVALASRAGGNGRSWRNGCALVHSSTGKLARQVEPDCGIWGL